MTISKSKLPATTWNIKSDSTLRVALRFRKSHFCFPGTVPFQNKNLSSPIKKYQRVPNSSVKVAYFIWFLRSSPSAKTPSPAPFHLTCPDASLATAHFLAPIGQVPYSALCPLYMQPFNKYLSSTSLNTMMQWRARVTKKITL